MMDKLMRLDEPLKGKSVGTGQGAAIIVLAMLGSGCTSSGSSLTTQTLFPVTLTAPASGAAMRYGDNDPVDFGKLHPGIHPVHGIDVSKYQGTIDWDQTRRAGVAFAFMKATEGGDRVDARFDQYWRQARAVGIPHAPYHFYYFCTPAAVQAQWFIRNVPKSAVKLPPVLDMEWNPASPSCKLRPDPETVRSEMQIWLKMVERHYGKRPIIYTTVDFHRENIDGHFRAYPFWLRSVAAHPSEIYPGHHWTFWQYTGTGQIPGIEGDADINAFAGTQAEWKQWLQKHGS